MRVPSQVTGSGLLTVTGPAGMMAEPSQPVTAGGVGVVAALGQATVAAPLAGTIGLASVPGTVTTATDSALVLLASASQAQRVLMLCAGPFWTYPGSVLLQLPPLTWYCSVEPAGQGMPVGAVMRPPESVQAEAQLLLVILTLAGAPLKVGQTGVTVTTFVVVQPLALV